MTDTKYRPKVMLDSWLESYGYKKGTIKSAGENSMLYANIEEGGENRWRLFSVNEDGSDALKLGVGEIMKELVDRQEEGRDSFTVKSLLLVGVGEGGIKVEHPETGEPADPDLFTDESIIEWLSNEKNKNGLTLEQVRGGVVPVRSVHLITDEGLAAHVTLFYEEPHTEIIEQWVQETDPEPQGIVDILLMSSFSFLTLIEATIERGREADIEGLTETAFELAKESPANRLLLSYLLKVIANGIAEGDIDVTE